MYYVKTVYKDTEFSHAYIQWTNERPIESGWYWVRWTTRTSIDPILVYVAPDDIDGHLIAWVVGFAQPFELHYFHPWLGPLPVPQVVDI